MCGTDIAYAATVRYAMSGTGLVNLATLRCAMSGTDIAYAATRLMGDVVVSLNAFLVCSYACAMRCPVLTRCMLLGLCYAVSGTNLPYASTPGCLPTLRHHPQGAKPSYHLSAMQCLALTQHVSSQAPSHTLHAQAPPAQLRRAARVAGTQGPGELHH
eukprot:3934269-Rhodomonas_salina.5